MQLYVLLGIYAAVLGLIVGSYLNVVIYRVPRGISTVLPRSRCPGCGNPIRPADNVPVLSYLLLRGRCRTCGTPIHWRYPAIEAATGLLFVACFLRFGPTPDALAAAVFACVMVALAAIDVEHLLLPDRITLPGAALGIAIQPLLGYGQGWATLPGWLGGGRLAPWLSAVLGGVFGAAVGAGILLALYLGWLALRREEGMGLGDVKMLALVGAFLGWPGVLICLFFSSLAGAVTGIALMAVRGGDLKSKLPFGAFLALGGLIALLAGPEIAAWYGGLLVPPLPPSP